MGKRKRRKEKNGMHTPSRCKFNRLHTYVHTHMLTFVCEYADSECIIINLFLTLWYALLLTWKALEWRRIKKYSYMKNNKKKLFFHCIKGFFVISILQNNNFALTPCWKEISKLHTYTRTYILTTTTPYYFATPAFIWTNIYSENTISKYTLKGNGKKPIKTEKGESFQKLYTYIFT